MLVRPRPLPSTPPPLMLTNPRSRSRAPSPCHPHPSRLYISVGGIKRELAALHRRLVIEEDEQQLIELFRETKRLKARLTELVFLAWALGVDRLGPARIPWRRAAPARAGWAVAFFIAAVC